ncbi:Beclin-1, partial [Durusdinium trenchii]
VEFKLDGSEHDNLEVKRKQLALALGQGRDPDDPCDDPEVRMLRSVLESPQDVEIVVDTHLCTACIETAQGLMRRESVEHLHLQNELKALERELDKAKPQIEPITDSEVEMELLKAMQEQGILVREIEEVERQRAKVRAEMDELDAEEAALQAAEEVFWTDRAALLSSLDAIGDKQDGLVRQIRRSQTIIKELTPIHAFNHAFFIWRDGDYGTINGFRLGQIIGESKVIKRSMATSARPPPDWDEINTAWGLSAMLLSAIAHSQGYTFSGFKVLPMGSRTSIEAVSAYRSAMDFIKSGNQRYPLFFDPERSRSVLNRLFNGAVDGFNSAMRAFMTLLQQLCDLALQSETGIHLQLFDKMYPVDVPDARHKIPPPNSCTINGDSIDLTHSPFCIDAIIPPSAQSSPSLSPATPPQPPVRATPQRPPKHQQHPHTQPSPEFRPISPASTQSSSSSATTLTSVAHMSPLRLPSTSNSLSVAGAPSATQGSLATSDVAISEDDIEHAHRWTVALRHVLTNLKWLL